MIVYFIYLKRKESTEWEPSGVWKSLEHACHEATRGFATRFGWDEHSVTQLKWKKYADWSSNAELLGKGVESIRSIRVLGREHAKN